MALMNAATGAAIEGQRISYNPEKFKVWANDVMSYIDGASVSINTCSKDFGRQMENLVQPGVWSGDAAKTNYNLFKETHDALVQLTNNFGKAFEEAMNDVNANLKNLEVTNLGKMTNTANYGNLSAAQIEEAEHEKMANKVNKILAYGCDIFINRQLIYNYPEQLMADKGIMVIEHADFDGIERLAAVTGGEIYSTFDSPESAVLGTCEKVEEVMIGEDKVIKFSGCKNPKACTIVLRGASAHLLEEAERSLHDALCVICETVKSHNLVYGGGFTEMIMAKAVDELAKTEKGKESICIESFAKALRQIPTIICDNAGYDSSEIISNLKKEINDGSTTAGIDINKGAVGDMKELGIYECLKVKEQALMSASEAAEMIIRVDMTFTAPPRERTDENSRPC